MGFATMADLVCETVTNGKSWPLCWGKAFADPGGTTDLGWVSGWPAAGMPAAGSNPATTPGTAYTSTPASPVTGSFPLGDRAGETKHILRMSCAPVTTAQAGTLMLYDRLYGVSSVAITSTGNRALNNGTVSLARYASGEGVIPVLEVTTAGTTTIPVVTLESYVDQAGNTEVGAPSLTFPTATAGIATMFFLPLAAGDNGCRSITTLNVVTADAAMVCNALLIKPLAFLPVVAGWAATELTYVVQSLSLPRVYDGACLALAYASATSTTFNFCGHIEIGFG